jgi:predicted O-linked N-acetylglucosamine transferase (SPINDLY family)
MLQEQQMGSLTTSPADVEAVKSWPIAQLLEYAESNAAKRIPNYSSLLYKNWIDANPHSELLYTAYYNYAASLTNGGDLPGANAALRECIRLHPDFAPAYINLGRVLEDSGDAGAAVGEWLNLVRRLASVDGDKVKNKLIALQQIARVLLAHGWTPQAEDALKQSLDIDVQQPEVIQHWIDVRQGRCLWPLIEGWEHEAARVLMAKISPLSIAKYADDPMFQLARAYKYNKELIKAPASAPRRWAAPTAPRSSKLKIGYVSSDLREHAVGFGMAQVFEEHDRQSFEIHAYYCGIPQSDSTKERFQRNADKWIDINGLSDEEVAGQIARDEVDILVDLNGYTRSVRMRVFAMRPAPIIVNWFGFPGTMGSSYHNYIIADEHIIPKDHEIYYSEKVLRLPCYQPNDRKRLVAPHPQRADENLPEDAFVYCCLNGMDKVNKEVFMGWLEILKNVEGSVLWLLSPHEDTVGRLLALVEQNGIHRDRLIFGKTKPNPQHLARYALADLFLDTFPYGAHTTASDSLWMGVPVLTVRGRSFASRVCASLLNAAGVPELVCPDHQGYVAKAIALGNDQNELKELKSRLAVGRDTCLLFDTPLLVGELENLYRGMWEDFKRGALPKPDLKNLDAYCDIGADLILKGVPACGEDLKKRYAPELEIWNETWPLQPDSRFWRIA